MANSIQNPEIYRQMSQPRPAAEVDASMAAFFNDLYELRAKHKLTDVLCTVRSSILLEDGGESHGMSSMLIGDALAGESIAAWTLGHEQSRRQQFILGMIEQGGPVIRGAKNRK